MHGVKREHKIQLWASEGWYCADFCIPHKKLIVEADGGVHNFTKKRDVVRDFRLNEKGWDVLRIDVRTIKKDPRGVKRKVRRYLRG